MNDRKIDVCATQRTEFKLGAGTKVVVQMKSYRYIYVERILYFCNVSFPSNF